MTSARVAVLGAGPWGRNHIRTLHAMGRLGAVVEPNEQVHQDIQGIAPGAPILSRPDVAALGDLGIAAAVVATPVVTHKDLAVTLLGAGFDVLVEKPMALSSEDAQAMVDAAVAHQRVLTVGHMLLFQPAIQYMARAIREGEIGELRSIHARRRNFGRVREHENSMWSLGVHDVAVLLDLVGSEPTHISATGRWPLGRVPADDVSIQMSFAGGVTVDLHTSWLWPEKDRGMTVIGSAGMFVYSEDDQSVVLHRKSVGAGLQLVSEGTDVVFRGEAEPLRLELEAFCAAIESRIAAVADGSSGLAVTRVLAAAQDQLDLQYDHLRGGELS